jgi:DNA mismatch endonuclease, patch repair protein
MKYRIEQEKRIYIRDGRAPIPSDENISKVMSANKAKNTKPELILRRELWKNGIKGYRLQWKKAPGKPDIAFPGKKIAIFVNGCFWHRCPICKPSFPKTNIDFWANKFERNIERDQRKKMELELKGWEVIIIWECQIKNDIKPCVEIVGMKFRNSESALLYTVN